MVSNYDCGAWEPRIESVLQTVSVFFATTTAMHSFGHLLQCLGNSAFHPPRDGKRVPAIQVITYLFINWLLKRHNVVNFRGAISSQETAETIFGTHCTHPQSGTDKTRMADQPTSSPILVLTGLDVAELRWCDERRYRYAKPATIQWWLVNVTAMAAYRWTR